MERRWLSIENEKPSSYKATLGEGPNTFSTSADPRSDDNTVAVSNVSSPKAPDVATIADDDPIYISSDVATIADDNPVYISSDVATIADDDTVHISFVEKQAVLGQH